MNKRKFNVIPFQQQSKIRGGDDCDQYCICYFKKSSSTCDKAAHTARHTSVVTATSCSGGSPPGEPENQW